MEEIGFELSQLAQSLSPLPLHIPPCASVVKMRIAVHLQGQPEKNGQT